MTQRVKHRQIRCLTRCFAPKSVADLSVPHRRLGRTGRHSTAAPTNSPQIACPATPSSGQSNLTGHSRPTAFGSTVWADCAESRKPVVLMKTTRTIVRPLRVVLAVFTRSWKRAPFIMAGLRESPIGITETPSPRAPIGSSPGPASGYHRAVGGPDLVVGHFAVARRRALDRLGF